MDTTTSSSNPPRPSYLSSSTSPPPLSLPIAAHLFSAQPPLGMPANPPPPPPPPPPHGLTYQIPGPGRGVLRRTSARTPSSGQIVTVANPAGYIRNNSPTTIVTYPASQARPYVLSYDHTALAAAQQPPVHQMRPPMLSVVPRQFGSSGVRSGPLPNNSLAATQTKVTPFSTGSSAAEHNNYVDLRDRSRDDTVVTVKDRKVRLLDGGSDSFYALCRSWVQNGMRHESQSNFGDGVKLLPRPFPATVTNSTKPNKNDDDSEKEEHVGDISHLSTRDLLDRHLKRSKRIRARFKEERRRRIGRFKQRLSLLFPTPEEQTRNDATPGS